MTVTGLSLTAPFAGLFVRLPVGVTGRWRERRAEGPTPAPKVGGRPVPATARFRSRSRFTETVVCGLADISEVEDQ